MRHISSEKRTPSSTVDAGTDGDARSTMDAGTGGGGARSTVDARSSWSGSEPRSAICSDAGGDEGGGLDHQSFRVASGMPQAAAKSACVISAPTPDVVARSSTKVRSSSEYTVRPPATQLPAWASRYSATAAPSPS